MKTKKILAGALAAAVVTTSLPGMGVPVFAADSFLTPDSNCYTTDNPFAFPTEAGEVQTLQAERATTLYNKESNDGGYPMKILTNKSVEIYLFDFEEDGTGYPYLYKTVTAQNKEELQLVMFPNLKITFEELFDLGEY